MATAATATNGKRGRGPTRIQSVARASRLLLYVAGHPEGCTAKQAAEAFGLSLPTAYHLLNTLVAEGLLGKDASRRYAMGPKIGVMSRAFLRDNRVPEWLSAPLKQLATTTGESTYLAAWQDNDVRVLATVEGAHAVRVTGLKVGASGDAHARASGKLILAFESLRTRDEYFADRTLRALTPSTLTRRDELEAEFARIVERGYAFDEEEYTEGVRCVAVPVFDEGIVIAVYTVSAPAARFDEHREEFVAAGLEAARIAVTPPDPEAE